LKLVACCLELEATLKVQALFF